MKESSICPSTLGDSEFMKKHPVTQQGHFE